MSESQSTSRAISRLHLFVRGQLSFVVLLALIAPLVVLSGPLVRAEPRDDWRGLFGVGIGLAVLAVVLALAVPWERDGRRLPMIVPALDLVCAAFVYSAAFETMPSAYILAAFPVLWLAFGFHRSGLAVAIVGSFFVAAFPLLWRAEMPDTLFLWGRTIMIPLCAAVAAVWLYLVARALRLRAEEAESAARELGRTEAKLEDRIFLTSAIIDVVEVGVVFYDRGGEVQHLNAAAREIFELAAKPVREGEAPGLFIFGPDALTPIPAERQVIPRALAGEHVVGEFEWLGKPGSQRAVLVSARRVLREDGSIVGTVVAAQDVTRLAHATQVREDFLLSVSHELRTPLTSIVGYVDLLEDAVDTEALGIRREFEVIRRNAGVLLDRIGDLLAMPDSDVELDVTDVDVSRLVARSVEGILPRARAARVTVHAVIDPPVVAAVDESRFRQVIDNLLSNSVKYTPAGGSATLTLREVDGMAELTVDDTGVGMSADEIEQVFDPLYRARQARDGAAGGFGIGLSITQRIVAAHGGTIGVASERGRGTTVTVRVPARVPAPDPVL